MTPPAGSRVRLLRRTRVLDGGRLLLGGSPLTALRVTDTARALLVERTLAVTDAATARLARRLLDTDLAAPAAEDLPVADPADLTVVIPVRDRPGALERALAALSELSVIVVDDASTRPAEIAATSARHGATLLPLAVNRGPAGARNAGLCRVRTPLVAFVDSDVRATSSALLALSRHFADPEVSVVGPRVVAVPRGPRPRWFEEYECVGSSLDRGASPATVRPGTAVAWLPAACLLARTDAVGEGFDPTLRVGEDVDLVWRLTDHGHTVRYDPCVVVTHDTRTTIRGWLGRKFLYGTSAATLAARHSGRLATAVLTPAYAVAAAGLLLRRRWALPLATAAIAWDTWRIQRRLPPMTGRTTTAARLALHGMWSALHQQSALVLRHWWPATAVGLPLRPVRRVVLSALVVDAVVAVHAHPPTSPVALLRLLAGRRLDDLAYGAGLWAGALRARSTDALRPRLVTRRTP